MLRLPTYRSGELLFVLRGLCFQDFVTFSPSANLQPTAKTNMVLDSKFDERQLFFESCGKSTIITISANSISSKKERFADPNLFRVMIQSRGD